MNKFLAFLCLALMASASAKPGYNYTPPSKGTSGNFKQQQQGFRPSQPASNSNVYTANLSEQINLGSGFNGPVSTQNSFSSTASAGGGLQPQLQLAQPFAPQVQQFVSAVQQPPQQQQPQQFIGPAPQFVAPPQQQQQQFAAPAAAQFVAPVQIQQQQQPQQFAAPVAQFSVSNQQQQQQQQILAPAPVAQFQSVNFPQQPQQQTIISKDIYIHSAPDEVEEIGTDAHNAPAGPIRKNYRIVFIKAPTQNVKLNVNALKRSQASNEEKTVIYVLSKKPDLSEIQGQLVAAQSEQKAHKPEVYFIKYKTQEEANRAQQEIQAQYDSLGGSTHISDEGVAPVHSVIGGGPLNIGNIDSSTNSIVFQGSSNLSQQKFVQHSHQSSQTISGGSSSSVNFGGAPAQSYLPAKKK